MKKLKMKLSRQKRIALIAHDSQKEDMINWCMQHRAILEQHRLCGTGTTAGLITSHTGIDVEGYRSGPLGGDIQIGAEVVDGNIDIVIFFCDPLMAQPHDPDVKALLRITQVYGVPIATNLATADFLISSHLMDEEYERDVLDFNRISRKSAERFDDEHK